MLSMQCRQLPAPPLHLRAWGSPQPLVLSAASQLRPQAPQCISPITYRISQRCMTISTAAALAGCRFSCASLGSAGQLSLQRLGRAVALRSAAEDGSAVSEAEAAPEGEEVDEAGLEGMNPLFSGQFGSVLQEALGRQGSGSLFDGPIQTEPPKQERRSSALEEVLLAALQNSRRTLHSLEASEKALGDSIAREKKQFERLHFCLKKANSDAAYLYTIEHLLEEKRSELCELRDYDADR